MADQVDEDIALANKFRAAAKVEWEKDGEIEIDGNAAVSFGDDNGAYVAAWVWVSNSEAGVATEEEGAGAASE